MATVSSVHSLRPEIGDGSLIDTRFRRLLPEEAWARLPLPIRRRFSKRLPDGGTIVYAGTVTESWTSRAGWCLAQAARLIGGPLPHATGPGAASAVTVTEDKATGGQVWTRLYARERGFPQVLHSSKRFAGPTGLEEYVGRGVGMALTVHVEDGALVFRSAGYFLHAFGRRLPLPAWATPGALTVTHAEAGGGAFRFTLEITHPRLGALLRQTALFREVQS
jgi:hypothetical protein